MACLLLLTRMDIVHFVIIYIYMYEKCKGRRHIEIDIYQKREYQNISHLLMSSNIVELKYM